MLVFVIFFLISILPVLSVEIHDAASGNLEKIRTLVEDKKVNVNSRGYLGETPLYWAARNGHLEVAQYLVLKGADVNLAESKRIKQRKAAGN
ncbi:MAG: ankyrin repeat domain-containing protein [Vulcanimicrobiota bacterium]